MTIMKNFSTRNRAKFRSNDRLDLKFIALAAIISLALIFVSIAFGVGVDPEVATFASP